MRNLLFLLCGALSGCFFIIGNQLQDADSDGFVVGVDCNDDDPSIHPDQEEPCVCDLIDQNCNGIVDDFPCDLACIDNDQDGFPSGTDCNDTDATVNPNAIEPCICDSIDQNCNGDPQDFDCEIACGDADNDGFDSAVDCNDTDSTIHPNQEEPCICDSIDQNCNGDPQDFDCEIACGDADGDGFDSAIDCNDNNPDVHPADEEACVCNAIDDNCNGAIDDFPCDIACSYLEAGSVCGSAAVTESCEPGLLCCYPCGVEGCDNVCMEPAQDGNCPLFP